MSVQMFKFKTFFQEWPIHGGEWTQASCSYPEIIVTGWILFFPNLWLRYIFALSYSIISNHLII